MATLSATPRFQRSITVGRATNFLSKDFFQDVNLFAHLYHDRIALPEAIQLSVFSVPDKKRISFKEAVASKENYTQTTVGSSFGPSWSTHWFHLKATIPTGWKGRNVQLLWDSNSEAMIWSKDGHPLQGLTGGFSDDRRTEYPLTKSAQGGETIELYVEMACNGMFGNGKNNLINPPLENRTFQLAQVELVIPNKEAWQLFYDLQIILGMAKELSAESARSFEALYCCNQVIDCFDRSRVQESLKDCLEISKKFLLKSGPKDGHVVHAVGNCHIDTAWLWPYAETRRKTARSWATQLRLLEEYPDYVFVASQAQQFEWLQQDYPSLFKEIQEVAKKENRFRVIGGTWTEMDCNVPSGEALCRQFLYGQRFFEKHFGSRCKVFWLPDTFGYAAQLPQILSQSSCEYFFTQKLSWNNINKFPNTTFVWVGLDGTKVLTHMAPCETYTAQADVADMVRSIKNNRDLAFSNASLMPYGNGDGGGGPQRAMLERIQRMKDVDGLPSCQFNGADTFFQQIEKNAEGLQEWKGELYFELHRGTYTSQAATKRYNRKLEILLRNVELVSVLCLVLKKGDGKEGAFKYPKEKLDVLWKDVLLNQFHDVLPGSSIEMVNVDARNIYAKVEKEANQLLKEALDRLMGRNVQSPAQHSTVKVLNTLAWTRTELVTVPVDASFLATSQEQQQRVQISDQDPATGYMIADQVGGFGLSPIQGRLPSVNGTGSARGFASEQDLVLENDFVIATFNESGQLVSLFDKRQERELVPQGLVGNRLVIFEDMPLYWDAWDVEVYSMNKIKTAGTSVARLGETGPLKSTIIVEHVISATSKATQTISLTSISPLIRFDLELDWDENRQFLKVEFPWDIRSDVATYDTQFGHLQRPTHYNTSQDYAKFEVCGQKFADLSEYGYGVALLNDCKYGYSCHGNVMRLSLVRAPKAPDAHCDIGHHKLSYAVLPHEGSFLESNVVREAFDFNNPLVVRRVAVVEGQADQAVMDSLVDGRLESLFMLEGTRNVILDTVKRAEDSDHIILRMHEAYGGRAVFKMRSHLQLVSIQRTNIMEDDDVGNGLGVSMVAFDDKLQMSERLVLSAFEILTLKLKLKTPLHDIPLDTTLSPNRGAAPPVVTTTSSTITSLNSPENDDGYDMADSTPGGSNGSWVFV